MIPLSEASRKKFNEPIWVPHDLNKNAVHSAPKTDFRMDWANAPALPAADCHL